MSILGIVTNSYKFSDFWLFYVDEASQNSGKSQRLSSCPLGILENKGARTKNIEEEKMVANE